MPGKAPDVLASSLGCRVIGPLGAELQMQHITLSIFNMLCACCISAAGLPPAW
jgi:hypothetical protein